MYKQEFLLLVYNKDVLCVIDKGQVPVCQTIQPSSRRNAELKDNTIPSHDPYIPRSHAVFYNCTALQCDPIKLYTLRQLSSPNLNLKSCYLHSPGKFECEVIKFHNFKSIDKLLFLKNNVENKTFYLVDCLLYIDRGRVCHRKEDDDSHAKLVDTGTIARPQEPNILSQNEFLCEENDDKVVNCDIDPYVPFDEGLKLKESVKISGDVLLKTGVYAIILRKLCIDNWCGFSGKLAPTRRSWFPRYDPPGGKIYRCYYAKRQQICKEAYHPRYNGRTWLDD